jgi:hypothetical protein
VNERCGPITPDPGRFGLKSRFRTIGRGPTAKSDFGRGIDPEGTKRTLSMCRSRPCSSLGSKTFSAVIRSGRSLRAAMSSDFYTPPYAYARMQVLERGIEAINSLDQQLLAEYLHRTTLQNIAGEMQFGCRTT